jgi:ERF superfamily
MNHVQRQMKPVIKDSTNPYFKSKYSDLSSVMEAIREPLGSHGLSIWQDATLDEQGVNITNRIVHVSGQWVEFGPLTIPLGKKDAHAVGSACSYGKRYALCTALGVVSDDDDGNQAVASQEKKKDLPKMIEKHQCVELNTLIEQCDAEYQANLWAYLNSQKISFFEEMDEKIFNKLKKGYLNNISQKFEHANC